MRPDPERPDDSQNLFYRMVVDDSGALRVELWDHGVLSGARRVSAEQRGKHLLARHVALATAELAQGLARQRLIRAKRLEREAKAERQAEAERRARERLERWALIAGAKGAWLSGTNAWLVGPSVGFQLNQPERGRLEFVTHWLAGDPGSVRDAAALSWFELELCPSYRFDTLSTSVGLDLAAAVVAFSGVEAIDDIPGQRQSWSARAGLRLRYQPRVSESLRLDVGPEAAYVLRDVLVTSEGGDRTRLGGVWVGLGLGFLLDS